MKRILYCLCFAFILFSCNSNDDSQSPENENFYALTVGNTWEYKWYFLEDNSDEFLGVSESISVIDIVEINNEVYFKFKKIVTGNPINENGEPTISGYSMRADGEYFESYRDSLGYLINEEGVIKFSNNDLQEYLIQYAPWGSVYGKLSELSIDYSVEAGNFECLENGLKLRVENDDGIFEVEGTTHYYSDGFGLISEKNLRFSNCDFCGFYEKRLESYNIN